MAGGGCLRDSRSRPVVIPAGHGTTTDKQTRTAIQVCAGCPVRRQCLEFAVNMGEAYGIWGGTTRKSACVRTWLNWPVGVPSVGGLCLTGRRLTGRRPTGRRLTGRRTRSCHDTSNGTE